MVARRSLHPVQLFGEGLALRVVNGLHFGRHLLEGMQELAKHPSCMLGVRQAVDGHRRGEARPLFFPQKGIALSGEEHGCGECYLFQARF